MSSELSSNKYEIKAESGKDYLIQLKLNAWDHCRLFAVWLVLKSFYSLYFYKENPNRKTGFLMVQLKRKFKFMGDDDNSMTEK